MTVHNPEILAAIFAFDTMGSDDDDNEEPDLALQGGHPTSTGGSSAAGSSAAGSAAAGSAAAASKGSSSAAGSKAKGSANAVPPLGGGSSQTHEQFQELLEQRRKSFADEKEAHLAESDGGLLSSRSPRREGQNIDEAKFQALLRRREQSNQAAAAAAAAAGIRPRTADGRPATADGRPKTAATVRADIAAIEDKRANYENTMMQKVLVGTGNTMCAGHGAPFHRPLLRRT